MFDLWKHLTPDGVQSTWAPVIERAADGQLVKQAWYFNGDFPWLGMAICAPVIGLWYWCTDQYIVQRALGAPNEQVARRGSVFAAVLKLFPVYLFIIPGLICFALAKSGKVPGLEVVYRHGLDTCCKRSHRTLQLFAGDTMLSCSTNFCSILLWRILETTQCERLSMGNDHRVCIGLVPHAGRYSDYTRSNKWICR